VKAAAKVLMVICVGVIPNFGLHGAMPSSGQTATSAADSELLRTTTSGDVKGFVGNHGAHTWLGVPFARPPVQTLRWRAPQPPQPWRGVRQAVALGGRCPQFARPLGGEAQPDGSRLLGREDCLYLNVYAPASARQRPVMLWIHGGGATSGHAGSYDGSRLATSQNVVVITTNYRLGLFGWFAHPALANGDPRDDSGNYGTLDIIRALEWTLDNISAFGGDPQNVTVFGQSAGAANVLSLVASPLAKGLFHRAVVQSGSLQLTPMEAATRFAGELGDVNSAPEIVNALLMADGMAESPDAARKLQQDMTRDEIRNYLYAKSAETIMASVDLFGALDDSAPPVLLADGYVLPAMSTAEIFGDSSHHNLVPIILGSNRDEPTTFMAGNPKHFDPGSDGLQLKDAPRYRREVKYGALAIRERGVDRMAAFMKAAGNPNVYAYRFDWDEEGVVEGVDMSAILGAGHGLEIAFVFGTFDRGSFRNFYANSPDREALSDSMMSYWSQFASAGNPGRGRDGRLPQWLAWETNGKSALILDTPSDQGIAMTDQVLSVASIKATLAADPDITDPRERCTYYMEAFGDGPHFDPEEYTSFGPDGCAVGQASGVRD
jgi:para-nitrobenzyl esterase